MVDSEIPREENESRSDPLGRLGTTLIGVYLVILPLLLLWTLVAVFPESPTLQRRTVQPPSAADEQATAAQTPAPGAETANQRVLPATEQQVATSPLPRFPSRTFLWLRARQIRIGPFNEDQGMLLLAILAGCLGSYLHAAQSFATFVGNRQARRSWVWWYVLRAPIGGTLGMLFYFVIRAGLTAGSTDVNPYGVVAFGGLAGWFSKQATDKLAEVFDTLFRTAKTVEYKDALAAAPIIRGVTPSPVPAGQQGVVLRITGEGFAPGATVRVGLIELPANVEGPTTLSVNVTPAQPAGTTEVVVVNPEPHRASSKPFPITFL